MKKFLILYIIGALFMTSCDDYLDVNVDPNNPSEVTPDLVLPVAQVYTAQYIKGDRRASHLGNMFMYTWSQSFGYSWYEDEFSYTVSQSFYPALFNNAYLRALKQYQDLINLDPMYDNYKAIGMIMKCYHFQLLVDFYGDVPYFDALQRGLNATPKYDDAELIYVDLLSQLSEAITVINEAAAISTTVGVGEDDVMFGGNMTKWKQFANTLKLRILVRMSDYDSSNMQTELNAIAAEGSGYITDDVEINPGYLNEEDKQNPMWAGFGEDVAGTAVMTGKATPATDYILDYYTETGDPRIDYNFKPGAEGHLGVPQGITAGEEYGDKLVSLIGPGILKVEDGDDGLKGYNMGANIFTLAESYFNQAEAALKGFGGNPKALYEAGVKASFNYLGVVGEDEEGNALTADEVATSYMNQAFNNVNYDFSSSKLEAIITQKWLAVQGITAEQSWFDYSRTGFPSNLPVSKKSPRPDRPVRLLYPTSEATGNPTNVPKQKDAFNDKIFWGTTK
nr:SusD/RagB family nutrient-binding outer membrane lipoprotein [uncultured Carboxylicivirga sp.]